MEGERGRSLRGINFSPKMFSEKKETKKKKIIKNIYEKLNFKEYHREKEVVRSSVQAWSECRNHQNKNLATSSIGYCPVSQVFGAPQSSPDENFHSAPENNRGELHPFRFEPVFSSTLSYL